MYNLISLESNQQEIKTRRAYFAQGENSNA